MRHPHLLRYFSYSLTASMLLPAVASGQSLIVNEYNGVTDAKFFDLSFDEAYEGRDYGMFYDATAGVGTYTPTTANADDDGADPRWDLVPTAVQMQGRIMGNGGNWIELVVTEDNLDLRGWSLEWSNADAAPDNAGTLTFSGDNRWANLRSGTILTIIETPDDLVPELPVMLPDGTASAAINVDTDFSTTPDIGDFTVNAWLGDATMFVTGDWKVDNDDWQVTIKDDLGAVVQGPVGEDVSGFDYGLSSTEIARLEADPIAGLNPASSYDDGDYSTFGAPNRYEDNTAVQNFDSLRGWWINRTPGDVDLDGDVDFSDFTYVQTNFNQAGYWQDGDQDGDGTVGFSDFTFIQANFGTTASTLTTQSLVTESQAQVAAGEMELIVDVVTGEITLVGNNANSSGFSLTSDSGSLTPDDDTDASPFQGYFANTTSLISAFSFSGVLIDGETLADFGFLVGGLQDLQFGYGIAGQTGTITGLVTYVPEPTTLAIMGLGGLAMAVRRRHR